MSKEFPPDLSLPEQRRILWIVLALNLLLTAGFGVTGWIADSSALVANALDNASDSLVYIISLAALSRGDAWKRGAARLSGVMLIVFAAGILIDAGRRYYIGSEPLGPTMIVMALVAVVVNGLCMWLLARLHSKDVNMRAATTFSLNDFVSNLGILAAGALVLWTGQNWPDLVVALLVAGMALNGAIEILRDAARDKDDGAEKAR